jgi:hypothetical protein
MLSASSVALSLLDKLYPLGVCSSVVNNSLHSYFRCSASSPIVRSSLRYSLVTLTYLPLQPSNLSRTSGLRLRLPGTVAGFAHTVFGLQVMTCDLRGLQFPQFSARAARGREATLEESLFRKRTRRRRDGERYRKVFLRSSLATLSNKRGSRCGLRVVAGSFQANKRGLQGVANSFPALRIFVQQSSERQQSERRENERPKRLMHIGVSV